MSSSKYAKVTSQEVSSDCSPYGKTIYGRLVNENWFVCCADCRFMTYARIRTHAHEKKDIEEKIDRMTNFIIFIPQCGGNNGIKYV